MEHELFDAAIHGRTQDVKKILDQGARVNLFNQKGQSPLRLAAYMGHADTVELLIDNGATVDETNAEYSRTPLWEASSQGHVATVDVLINNNKGRHGGSADLNAPNQYGWTPLHIAAWNGYADTVQHLLQAGANVNQMDTTKKNTALHYVASFHSHVHIANLLLDYGADLSLKNGNGKTALDLASESESNVGMQTTLLMHQVMMMQPAKHGFLSKQKTLHQKLLQQCEEGDKEEAERAEEAERTAASLQEEHDHEVNNKNDETLVPSIVTFSVTNQTATMTNFLSRLTGRHTGDSANVNDIMASTNTLLIVGVVEVIVIIAIVVSWWTTRRKQQGSSSKRMPLQHDKKER